MGQSLDFATIDRSIDAGPSVATGRRRLSVFPTDLGWFGLLGTDEAVLRLTIGHASADEVRAAAGERSVPAGSSGCAADADLPDDSDWFPELRRRLQQYSSGESVDFNDVQVCLPPPSRFQRRVLEATRRIGYGCTMTYAELGRRAGSPRASRAVGNVMASNRVPIIIPCHRVVASGGKWGGFSAPQGVDLKRRMLAMEAGVGER